MTDNRQCGCEIGSRQCLVPPFYIRLLDHGNEHDADASRRDRDQLLSLLPASYRKESGDLAAVCRHVTACVKKELDLERLTIIHDWLWVAGLPLPPRALHNQLLLGREILVTERMDMHLVWTTASAQDKHLLPPEVSWPAWRIFVEQLDTEHVYARVDPRFQYGELRLSRLNKIYAFTQTPLRGYVRRWNQYGTFFHDNFAWLASASLYIVIVLTAMQVGLATQSLGRNDAFQAASYGFTVFSILGPLIAVSLIVIAFCCIFVCNWMKAVSYRNRRLE
ncbi:hypothetical protein HIM_09512 [Hirsutella minnesotensis 3608]|uniref:Uncharacterized protein n=1 Tax=Hirsutella minnesotensis 3608 TaxID=1043627 RepID=A0A0F7ZSB9_9HYPO|nr:hypothetical protein HIM_09512 [Hirsutella minnesotensis 3608]